MPPLARPYKADPNRISQNRYQIDGQDIQVVMRSEQPSIVHLINFLSPEECDELIERSRPRMFRSMVYTGVDEEMKVSKQRRSFSGQFKRAEDDFIARIDNRICAITGFTPEQGETLHVGSYEPGGYVKAHTDYFTLETLPEGSELTWGGWRVATFLIYLNDVEEGGETYFHMPGIKIQPRKGSVIYWEYCNALGQMDDDTLHEGCPVTAGEKWIVTKWFRQNGFPEIPLYVPPEKKVETNVPLSTA